MAAVMRSRQPRTVRTHGLACGAALVLAFGLMSPEVRGEPLGQLADIGVEISDTPDPVPVGATLTYSVRVTNHGPGTASFVSIADRVPNGLTLIAVERPAQFACTAIPAPSGSNFACDNSAFIPPGSVNFTLVFRLDEQLLPTGSTITNTVREIGHSPDPNPGNNAATATTTVGAPLSIPALSIKLLWLLGIAIAAVGCFAVRR